VPNEISLLNEKERLDFHGIPHVIFREPDIGDQATALATAPTTDKKFFSRYKLWSGSKYMMGETNG